MEASASASNTTFESNSTHSRKRPRYEVDDQAPVNTQLLEGINIVDDESPQPKFIKLVNNSNQDTSFNGWVLKRKVGSQSYEYKFPKGMVLKSGATSTVRRSCNHLLFIFIFSRRSGVPTSTTFRLIRRRTWNYVQPNGFQQETIQRKQFWKIPMAA